jgi:hypothetical protein
MKRRLLSIVPVLLLLGASAALAGDVAGKRLACTGSTEALRQSCLHAAESDYQLALGICLNSSGQERHECQGEAWSNLKDARSTCGEQRDARQEVCDALGEASYDPVIDPGHFVGGTFVGVIDNPYFPLTPGTTLVYEGNTGDGIEHEEFAVTHNTKVILGVRCVEVHDTVTLDGELIEDTLDWFAQDRDGNVWYFGESSESLRGGRVVGVGGSWLAGVDGAKPGVVMEAHPSVGDVYRQEFLPGTAEDLGEVIDLHAAVSVPAGTFSNCLETKDFTPLEPDALENKFYAPGVGTVLEIDQETGERLELLRIEH